MHISKATVSSPLLKYPMTNVAASVTLADDIVQVGLYLDGLDCRAGILSEVGKVRNTNPSGLFP